MTERNDEIKRPDPHLVISTSMDDIIRGIVKKLRRDTVYKVETFLEEQQIALFYTYMKDDERLVGDRANTDIIRRVLEEDE